MGIIYLSKNKTNGKVYVGKTTRTLKQRQKEHFKDAINHRHISKFHNAINKYGFNNFIWEIIDSDEDPLILSRLERLHISRYESFENGYNLTTGGEGISGFKRSQETKDKMSKAKRGKKRQKFSEKNVLNIINASALSTTITSILDELL